MNTERLTKLRVALYAGLGERYSQVVRLGQLVVVHFDEGDYRFVHTRQLDQSHFSVFTVKKEENFRITVIKYINSIGKPHVALHRITQ